jgi:hypothetical protein
VATASVTYSFTAATTAVASQVNQDFTDILTFLNASVVQTDGSLAMTGALSLPASDPVSANQASRKSYVDQFAKYKGASSTSLTQAHVGTLQVTDTGLIVKSAEWIGNTGSPNANVDLTFSTAFPNSVAAVLVTIADGAGYNNNNLTFAPLAVVTHVTLSAFSVKFFTAAPSYGLAANTSVAFSWLALGN